MQKEKENSYICYNKNEVRVVVYFAQFIKMEITVKIWDKGKCHILEKWRCFLCNLTVKKV